MTMGPQYPPNVPAHWMVYFSVQDADQTIKRAEELGARAMFPPMDIPQGRFTFLTDPQGAAFAIISAPR